MPKKQVPSRLPKRAAKEADAQYIDRVFRALYGDQERVKPKKVKRDAVHRS